MDLKPGTRMKSVADSTEVVIVRGPAGAVDLRCGGHPMVAVDAAAAPVEPSGAHSGGTQLGKRYADPDSGLELLCTKAGPGSLSLGDEPLLLKDAKPLPSSD
jgi:hypothetical protein